MSFRLENNIMEHKAPGYGLSTDVVLQSAYAFGARYTTSYNVRSDGDA